eukprot:4568309-Pleurochrysis_carterae.AAC.1
MPRSWRCEAVEADALSEERVSLEAQVDASRTRQLRLDADEDEQRLCTRDARVKQLAVEHPAVLTHHGHHDHGILGPLRLVHGHRIAQRHHPAQRPLRIHDLEHVVAVALLRPVEAHSELERLGPSPAHFRHHASVAVEDLKQRAKCQITFNSA